MKKWFQNLRFKNLQVEIQGYGYHYSFSKYVGSLIFGVALVITIGKLNGLKAMPITALVAVIGVSVPILLVQQFRYLYEQNRFQSLLGYMEQMMYSFQKHPKIITALEETEELTKGAMEEKVHIIRQVLETSKDVSYEGAFSILEKEYPCDRLKTVHDFFIKVEQIGGNYQPALAVLLEDTKLWTERTYLFQKERGQMKRKIVLSMACVLGLCSVLFQMMSGNEELAKSVDMPAYQMGTTVIFLLFIFLFLFSQKVLTGSWLKKPEKTDEEQIKKDWMHVKEDPVEFKRARRRLEREVEKQFPVWLRGVILSIQTENVYRAITESIDTAPFVLKGELEQLAAEIKEDPVSMRPYDHFLKELQIPEIHSVAKMLYAYTNTGSNEAKDQLNALMKRNMKLTDRAERMENEDEIAKYSMIFYLPMFLGTGKIMLDMAMLFIVMFSSWSQMIV